MRRALVLRIVGYWFAFGLGGLVGGWIVGGHAGQCNVRLVEVSADQVTQAVQQALPAAATGSGEVEFRLDVTGLHVHAASAFKDQDFDTTIPAVVRGSPTTVEVSARILSQMLSH
jgi:hypothetical protein